MDRASYAGPRMSLSVLAAAAETTERLALLTEDRELSFAELAGLVRGEIVALRGLGITEPRVALLGESTLPTLVTLLACIELGLPVALLHPRWPERERARWLAEMAPCRLLAPAVLAASMADPELPVIDPERALAIVATSGSSGRPKGVVLSRRAFLAAAAASAANLGWRDDDRWRLALPLAHVGGLSILIRCLVARRAVVVAPSGPFDPARLAHDVEGRRITLLSLVPTQLRRLLELEPPWPPPAHLRAILLGGAAASPALLAAADDRGWPVLATYGLTEACSQVATQRPGTRNRGELGCGPPLPRVEVRVREGVIEVRGPTLLSGYLPEGSGPEPITAEGWLRTGDLGRLDEAGRLHVLGRCDEVIVTGGENVHPAEVEAVLEAHPAIAAACVFGVTDAVWGQGIAAALVGISPLSDGELSSFLAERLAGFKRPRRIAWLSELPQTATGKLDRRRVAELAEPLLRGLNRLAAS